MWAATVLFEDNFDDGVIDSNKWTTGGSTVIEHYGYLDIQQAVTDSGGWATPKNNFAPSSNLKAEMRHKMHAANDYYYYGINFEATDTRGSFSVSLTRTGWTPSNCDNPSYYNRVKISVGDNACYLVSNLVSSDYYDRWITTTVNYDVSTGNIVVDLDSDGVIDVQATVLADQRFPIEKVGFGEYGWWTGHYMQVDYIKVEQEVSTYTITPSANPAASGTFTPTGAQTVKNGTTQSFTVTANFGYTTNPTVTGTCPQGTWNSNVWTTGAITANCTVIFNFTVTPPITSCTTNAATGVTATSATLNGQVTSNSATAAASFDFGPTTAYGTSIAAVPAQVYSSTAVAVTAAKTGLDCGSVYHFRCQAASSAGTGLGADQSFTTAVCPIYTVTPSAGIGGTVSPSTAQTVTKGLTKAFTVTSNAGYTRNQDVGGTCPKGSWNGNNWTTGDITANCTVSFSFTINEYTVIPSAGTGGSVTPSTPQTITHGSTSTFTVTPNANYKLNNAVTGTCPKGNWSGNMWTTGFIIADCTVNFSFDPITKNGVCGSSNNATFPVAPTTGLCSVGTASAVTGTGPWNWSCAGLYGGTTDSCTANISRYTVTPMLNPILGGSVNPSAAQTVTHGASTIFTVTASSGYTINGVTGTCQAGSWNGNKWTTGAITTNCTVIFGFTCLNCPVSTWFHPADQKVVTNKLLTLDIHANSNLNGNDTVGSYDFTVNFDKNKLQVDTAYQNDCEQGVCPGTGALASNYIITDNTNGTIRLSGLDTEGKGPSNDLQLLVIHFKALQSPGTTQVGLTLNELTNSDGISIGSTSKGATVTISPCLCGDSDGGYNVNIVDSLSIARYVIGLPPPPTVNVNCADVNRNGAATIVDALLIAKYSVGLQVIGTCTIGQPL